MATNVAVIYYSSTGTTYTLAKAIADAAGAAGAEVRLRRARELAPDEAVATNAGWGEHLQQTADVPEPTHDDMTWADAVVFGTPTRYGNVSAQLKQFIDTLGPLWQQGLLADKVYSGFVTASTMHGGQESTLLALYTSVHHFGGIIASPGYTDPTKFVDGNPYGTSFASGQGNPVDDVALHAAKIQAERVVKIATALKAGLTGS